MCSNPYRFYKDIEQHELLLAQLKEEHAWCELECDQLTARIEIWKIATVEPFIKEREKYYKISMRRMLDYQSKLIQHIQVLMKKLAGTYRGDPPEVVWTVADVGMMSESRPKSIHEACEKSQQAGTYYDCL